MFSGTGLAEERVEGVVAVTDGFVAGHLAVGLDPVLQSVQFPAGVAHLDPGLTQVYGYHLALKPDINFI